MNNLLVLLMFIVMTLQYRIELGVLSFALMEPVVLVVSAVLLVQQVLKRGSIFILKDPFIFLFIGLALWVLLVRSLGLNWQRGLSDVRNWIIPVWGFMVLVSVVRDDWYKKVQFLIVVAFLQGLFAIYQALTDSGRVFVTGGTALYKTGFRSTEEGVIPLASYGVGTFSHPNTFGYFMALSLLVWLGLYVSSKKKLSVPALSTGIVLFVALILSYAKTSILLFFLFGPLVLLMRVKGLNSFLPLASVGSLMMSIAVFLFLPLFSPWLAQPEFATLIWRFDLWQRSIDLLFETPLIALVGDGDAMMALLVSLEFFHPHNLPLYFLLAYGLPGLVWLVFYALTLCFLGVIWLNDMRRDPLLSAVYLCLSAILFVGMFDVMLQGIEARMMLLLFLACFSGIRREVHGLATQEVKCKVDLGF